MALLALSQSDPSRLHPDAFDVRGWEVRTEKDDEKAGTVKDLLVDGSGMPHLLRVDLGVFRKHVLVPLGHAWADASRRVVWVEGLAGDDLKRMPDASQLPDPVSEDFERRLEEDFAGVASDALRADPPDGDDRLARLEKLPDVVISKGSSDPRGWKVVAGDGAKLGKVGELIVDRDEMSVRYLDVDVDEKELGLEAIDRHVLLPVERARFDHKRKTVVLDGLFKADLQAYPVFTGLPLAKGMVAEIEERFRGGGRRDDAWVDRSARRFFDGGRRRGRADPEAPASATIVRPREGEEVRIRMSGGELVIERRPSEDDRG